MNSEVGMQLKLKKLGSKSESLQELKVELSDMDIVRVSQIHELKKIKNETLKTLEEISQVESRIVSEGQKRKILNEAISLKRLSLKEAHLDFEMQEAQFITLKNSNKALDQELENLVKVHQKINFEIEAIENKNKEIVELSHGKKLEIEGLKNKYKGALALLRTITLEKNDVSFKKNELIQETKNICSLLNGSELKMSQLKSELDFLKKEMHQLILVRDEKKNLLKKEDKAFNEIGNDIKSLKFVIQNLRNEISELSLGTNRKFLELKKLKELELVTSLSLDHIAIEKKNHEAKIEVLNVEISKENIKLKEVTNKLFLQQQFLEQVVEKSKLTAAEKLKLYELSEQTANLIKINAEWLEERSHAKLISEKANVSLQEQ